MAWLLLFFFRGWETRNRREWARGSKAFLAWLLLNELVVGGWGGPTKDHTCGCLSKLQTLEAGVQHQGPSFLGSVSPPSLKHTERVSKREPGTLHLRKVMGKGLVEKACVSQGHCTK